MKPKTHYRHPAAPVPENLPAFLIPSWVAQARASTLCWGFQHQRVECTPDPETVTCDRCKKQLQKRGLI